MTEPAVAEKLAVDAPAATVTEAGAVKAALLLGNGHDGAAGGSRQGQGDRAGGGCAGSDAEAASTPELWLTVTAGVVSVSGTPVEELPLSAAVSVTD